MPIINVQQILNGDTITQIVEKINYNFDQLVLNGGGPLGPRGLQGDRGIPGPPGSKGLQGVDGQAGSKWYFGSGHPTTGTLIYPSIPPLEYINGDIWLDTNTSKIYAFQSLPEPGEWVDTTTNLANSFFSVDLNSNYYLNNRDGKLIVGYDDKTSPSILDYPVNPDDFRLRVVSNVDNQFQISLLSPTDNNIYSATLGLQELSVIGDPTQKFRNLKIFSPDGISIQASASNTLDMFGGHLKLRSVLPTNGTLTIDFPTMNFNSTTSQLRIFNLIGSDPGFRLYGATSTDLLVSIGSTYMKIASNSGSYMINNTTYFSKSGINIDNDSAFIRIGTSSGNGVNITPNSITAHSGVLSSNFNTTSTNNYIGIQDLLSGGYSIVKGYGFELKGSSTLPTVKIAPPTSGSNTLFTQNLIAADGNIAAFASTEISFSSGPITSKGLALKDLAGNDKWFFPQIGSPYNSIYTTALWGQVAGSNQYILHDCRGNAKWKFPSQTIISPYDIAGFASGSTNMISNNGSYIWSFPSRTSSIATKDMFFNAFVSGSDLTLDKGNTGLGALVLNYNVPDAPEDRAYHLDFTVSVQAGLTFAGGESFAGVEASLYINDVEVNKGDFTGKTYHTNSLKIPYLYTSTVGFNVKVRYRSTLPGAGQAQITIWKRAKLVILGIPS